MAFFNYSTMQMTAKIVYYGPGLCGKTTNLQFIHGHTTQDSRGEMVSLETQTDRTLFFDLLPMEVGRVAGFRTKIQLYTVPGQVFYNTTRKLVLKGVDGVVFVADSQRPMLTSNLEALNNLEENLGGLGLALDRVPLVLQYNKRDLQEIASVEELEGILNPKGILPSFEASAITGMGVFETLRGISRLTLISLKRQLEQSSQRAGAERAAAKPAPRPEPVEPPPPAPAPGPAAAPAPPAPAPTAEPAVSANGRATIERNLLLRLKPEELARAREILVSLEVRDRGSKTLHEIRDLGIEIAGQPDLEELLLKLDIALNREGS